MPNLGDTSLKANPQSLGTLPVDVTWMQDRLGSTNPTDWFDFNLSQSSLFSTRISWNGNTGANLKLSVYNANNQLLGTYSSPNAASVTSGYDTSIKYSDTVLSAGNYRVEVVDLNKVAVNYELKLSNALATTSPTPTPSTPTPSADTTPPSLVNHTPSNNSVVSNPQDFVFNFSESVKQGTGTIKIDNLSKGGGRTIDIQNPSAGTDNAGNSISVNGSQMTLHLGTPISNDSAIEITMTGGGVTDLAGNVYAGLGKGQFDFSTPTTVNTTPSTPVTPTTPTPTPAADNDGTLITARQLNSLVVGTTPPVAMPFLLDSIGGSDNNDFYKFHLDTQSNFAARLSYTGTNPLLKIYKADGTTPVSNTAANPSEPDTQSSKFPSANTQKFTANLAVGDYYIQVAANGSSGTDYGLRLSNTPITTTTPAPVPVTPAPVPTPAADNDGTTDTATSFNTISGALETGTTPIGTPFHNDRIGGGDNNDFYKFHLAADSNFAARLSYTGTNPLLKIYKADGTTPVSNTAANPSEPDTQSSNFPSTNTQKFTANLAAGDYYLQVDANNSTGTDYGLRLSNTPITTQTPSTPVTPPTTTPVTPPTTTPVPVTPAPVEDLSPILKSNFPLNAATEVAKNTPIVLVFSEPVKAGSGSIDIVISNLAGASATRTIKADDTTQVMFSDAQMRIDPKMDLPGGSTINIRLNPDVVQDMTGHWYTSENPFSFRTNGSAPVGTYLTSLRTGNSQLSMDNDSVVQYVHKVNAGEITQESISPSPVVSNNTTAQPLSNSDYLKGVYKTFRGSDEIDQDGFNYWLKYLDNDTFKQGSHFEAAFVDAIIQHDVENNNSLTPLQRQVALNAQIRFNAIKTEADKVAADITSKSLPEISLSHGVSLDEGSGGGITPFTFTVTRSGNTSVASSVDYKVVPTSNTTSDTDFEKGSFPSGTVKFAAGEKNSQTFDVNVVGDTTFEPTESFAVELSKPNGATIGIGTVFGIIKNDDVGLKSAADIFKTNGYYKTFFELSSASYVHLKALPETGTETPLDSPDAKNLDAIKSTGMKILQPADLSLPGEMKDKQTSNYKDQSSTYTYKFQDGYYVATDDTRIDTSSVAFVARSDKALFLTFRGSDVTSDFIVSDPAQMRAHYARYEPLLNSLTQYIKVNGIQQVYVSGHSLGGQLATFYMQDHANTTSVQYEAVTFEAANKLVLATGDTRFTNFEMRGDAVPDLSNAINISFNSQYGNYGKSVYLDYETKFSVANLASHKMGNINTQFDKVIKVLEPSPNNKIAIGLNTRVYIDDNKDNVIITNADTALTTAAVETIGATTGGAVVGTVVGGVGAGAVAAVVGASAAINIVREDSMEYTKTGYDFKTAFDKPDGVLVIKAVNLKNSGTYYVTEPNVGNVIVADDTLSPSEYINIDGSSAAQNLTLVGNAGRNQLLGGAGNDKLIGGAGIDFLNGGAGDDVLYGNRISDSINFPAAVDNAIKEYSSSALASATWTIGDDANSYLRGGTGKDEMIGGNNNDYFFVDVNMANNDNNVDYIRKFNPKEDYLVFSAQQLGGLITNVADWSATSSGDWKVKDIGLKDKNGNPVNAYSWGQKQYDALPESKNFIKVPPMYDLNAKANPQAGVDPLFVFQEGFNVLSFAPEGVQNLNHIVQVATIYNTGDQYMSDFFQPQILVVGSFDNIDMTKVIA